MFRLALLAFLCTALIACSRFGGKRQAPNVVVLSIDTLRADSLRAYDPSARAHPNIDELAGRGHVFGHAYSTASWTLPAHASIFTGRYSDRHGATDRRHGIGDVSSFVETLRANGYQTVGFTDGGYVSAHFGFSRGFENYNDVSQPGSTVSLEQIPRGGKPYFDKKRKLFDRLTAFLRARTDPRPLFLFVQTYAVHDYFIRWLPGSSRRWTPESTQSRNCLLGAASCPPEKWRELEAQYEAEIESFDRALAPLLQLVKKTLGADNTYILLLSDHGEGFDYARNRIHHGGRLHRDQLQVPLFVSGPRIKPGRSEEPVSLVDIRASVMELTGIKDPDKTDGRSFAPVVLGSATPALRGEIWAHEFFHYWEQGKRRDTERTPKKSLAIARIDSRYWYIQGQSGEELYDVADRQQSELLSDSPGKVPRPTLRQTDIDSAPLEEDEKVFEQLRALGYIQ